MANIIIRSLALAVAISLIPLQGALAINNEDLSDLSDYINDMVKKYNKITKDSVDAAIKENNKAQLADFQQLIDTSVSFDMASTPSKFDIGDTVIFNIKITNKLPVIISVNPLKTEFYTSHSTGLGANGKGKLCALSNAENELKIPSGSSSIIIFTCKPIATILDKLLFKAGSEHNAYLSGEIKVYAKQTTDFASQPFNKALPFGIDLPVWVIFVGAFVGSIVAYGVDHLFRSNESLKEYPDSLSESIRKRINRVEFIEYMRIGVGRILASPVTVLIMNTTTRSSALVSIKVIDIFGAACAGFVVYFALIEIRRSHFASLFSRT